MRTYTEKGIYCEGTVYVMETPEDFDEYEKRLGKNYIDTYNPNFYSFREEFKEKLGMSWKDKKSLRYIYNGEPVYVKYRVIAVEDNVPMADWYWVVQNEEHPADVRRINCNDPDFYGGFTQ